jgi:hypothetical protein
MAKIETYSLDEALTANDKLVGSSYQPGGSYVTASYTLGQVRDYMSTAVGELQDRWSTISYRFSGEEVHSLGDAESGILDLDPSSGGNVKNWVLIPGVDNKNIVVSNVVVYVKKGTIDYNESYTVNFAMYNAGFTGFPGNLMYELSINLNVYEVDHYKSSGSLFGGYNCLVGKPLMLNVQNSSLMTDGNGELGIWIEYKYLDFNTDF